MTTVSFLVNVALGNWAKCEHPYIPMSRMGWERVHSFLFWTNSNLLKAKYSRQFLDSGHRTHMIHWILGKTRAQGTSPQLTWYNALYQSRRPPRLRLPIQHKRGQELQNSLFFEFLALKVSLSVLGRTPEG